MTTISLTDTEYALVCRVLSTTASLAAAQSREAADQLLRKLSVASTTEQLEIAEAQREECAEYVARQYVDDERKALQMRDLVLAAPLVRP